MSTNYYFEPAADNSLSVYGQIHIGKSSAGWAFGFRGYTHSGGLVDAKVAEGLYMKIYTPALVIKSYEDLKALLATSGHIVTEYGNKVHLDDFYHLVALKNGETQRPKPTSEDNWLDGEGNYFSGYTFF